MQMPTVRCPCYLLAIHLYCKRYHFSSPCPKSLNRAESSPDLGSCSLRSGNMHVGSPFVEVSIIYPHHTPPSLVLMTVGRN